MKGEGEWDGTVDLSENVNTRARVEPWFKLLMMVS